MAKSVKSQAALQRQMDGILKFATNKVAQAVKDNIEKHIREYYHEYTPEQYERTWKFLNSVIKTEPVKVGNGWEVEVYIDPDIEYSSFRYDDEPWTMYDTAYMANEGQHGRYATGYPQFFHEAKEDILNGRHLKEHVAKFLREKGIKVYYK